VAYADFVTAMMAFFLVMWIAAQDPKVRQAVARYFDNPVSFDSFGASRKPDRSGAVFDSTTTGSVPLADAVALGKGRTSYTNHGGSSPATKLVSDWLHQDDKSLKYWREQAQRELEWATLSPEVRDKLCTPQEAAARRLSRRLLEEVRREMPSKSGPLYQDLLLEALSQVNWTQVAEDLLPR
jgi:flagellar motor protein MotB